VQLFLDGIDVTSESEVYSNMIVYNVLSASGGKHEYKVSAKLNDGTEIESDTWKINISKFNLKQQLNLKGKAVFKSYYDNQQYDADSDSDKWANFLLQFRGEYKWLTFKSKIFVSSLETSKDQAVNRYNLSLYTKYFDFIGGDYTPHYGTFIMSSKNIMGVHTNLHFKHFRLKVTSGYSKRAVGYNHGTYSRNSIGIRTEIGSKDLFEWGLAVAKNKDDKTSINDSFYLNDTVTPKDNIIIGTDFTLSLFRKRLLWGAEAAISYYNDDIYEGTKSLDELNEEFDMDLGLPIDPLDFESIFVINENIEPFMPGFSSLAYKTYLRAFFYKNFLNINYSAVGTSFNSLSSNFLQKDNAILSVNDNINLFNNKLFLSLNLNLTSDNLYDEKDITYSSTNYSTQVNYRLSSAAYVKLGYMFNETANDDTLAYEYTTKNINFGGGYFVEAISFAPSTFSLTYNKYNSTGINEVIDDAVLGTSVIFESETDRDNVVFSVHSDFDRIPLSTIMSFTMSMTENLDASSDYNSIYLKGIYSLLDEKLKPYVNLNYTMLGGDYDKESIIMNVGTNYYLFSNTFLSTNIGSKMYKNNDEVDGSEDYSLYTWRLKISQNF